LCLAATKESGYLEAIKGFQLFDPETDRVKRDVADSLEYKGYIGIDNKDYYLKLMPPGVDYCNKLKKLL
jgi:hypothetical protein